MLLIRILLPRILILSTSIYIWGLKFNDLLLTKLPLMLKFRPVHGGHGKQLTWGLPFETLGWQCASVKD